MRIVCPACQAGYDVPDARLRPGLMLRCHRCGNEFAAPDPPPEQAGAPAAEPEAEPAPPAPPPLLATPRIVPPAPPRASRWSALTLAWIASVVVLASLAGAAVLWRDQVRAAWPPSARAYSALGLGR